MLSWLRVADVYSGEEFEGEEEQKSEFLCPFCSEDFDVVGLCCHIDEEHAVEAKNGVPTLRISLSYLLFGVCLCVISCILVSITCDHVFIMLAYDQVELVKSFAIVNS